MHSLTLWNAHAEVDAVDALRRSSEAGPYYCRYELDTRAEGAPQARLRCAESDRSGQWRRENTHVKKHTPKRRWQSPTRTMVPLNPNAATDVRNALLSRQYADFDASGTSSRCHG